MKYIDTFEIVNIHHLGIQKDMNHNNFDLT